MLNPPDMHALAQQLKQTGAAEARDALSKAVLAAFYRNEPIPASASRLLQDKP